MLHDINRTNVLTNNRYCEQKAIKIIINTKKKTVADLGGAGTPPPRPEFS